MLACVETLSTALVVVDHTCSHFIIMQMQNLQKWGKQKKKTHMMRDSMKMK